MSYKLPYEHLAHHNDSLICPLGSPVKKTFPEVRHIFRLLCSLTENILKSEKKYDKNWGNARVGLCF